MGAQIREYRQRIRSVSATKKITRAMELMAASRVVKAQQAVRESTPYAVALTKAVSAVAAAGVSVGSQAVRASTQAAAPRVASVLASLPAAVRAISTARERATPTL